MNKASRQEHLTRLRQALVTRFDDGELRTLCFDLGIDYADLPGEGRADKARELLAYLDRRDRIPELLEVGQRMRSDVPWSQVYLDDRMDLLRARRDKADRTRREMRERQRVVNLRPLDVIHTFKDRVHEVQALCDHLTDSSVRLVSVVGRGGMGKTALVSHVLGELEQGVLPVLDEKGEKKALPVDGILYLSALSTGLGLERIYADVGRMLGEPAASKLKARWAYGGIPLAAKIEYLLEATQDGLYLILLDNLESVMAEDGTVEEGLRLFVERCLTQPSGVRLIVTSREQVRVAAAALHTTCSISLREGLPEDEAVDLLRGLDRQGTLGLRDALEEDLRRAARLTRGIPRALEILVGILHEDPAANLSRLLADEDLLGERVVEQLVAAGYGRLGEGERRVLEALAVFDRPVEEAAVAYLLYPWWSDLDVRARLHRLDRGYFVSCNRVTGKCSLHPLDREYAYHQIPDASGREPDSYNQHNMELRAAAFYVSIRKPESEWKSIEDVRPQLAEFEHRASAGDYDCAHQVLQPIDANYLFLWGHYDRLVAMREKLVIHLTASDSQIENLIRLGLAYHSLGEFEKAIGCYEVALTTARETGNRKEEGRCLGHLGKSQQFKGEFEKATGLYEQALCIARDEGDREYEGMWLGNLGYVHRILGHLGQSLGELGEALTIARETGNRKEEARHLGNLGGTFRDLGEIERAREAYSGAFTIASEIGDRRYTGIWLGGLSVVYRDLREVKEAIDTCKKSLDIASSVGDQWTESNERYNLGLCYCAIGKFDEAIKEATKGLEIVDQIGDRPARGRHLALLGDAYLAKGQVGEAIKRYEEARGIAHETSEPRNEATRLSQLGIARSARGEIDEAISDLEKALEIMEEIEHRRGLGYPLLGLGRAHLTKGGLAAAQDYLSKALDVGTPATYHQVSLTLSIVLLRKGDRAAGENFTDTADRCRALLDRTVNLCKPQYTRAAALVGQAVCDPRWAERCERAELLALALDQYQRALENCDAAGIVQDALRDLELIGAAGIEGLEPAFELLESALEQ